MLFFTYTLNFGSFLLIIQNKYSKIIFSNSLKNSVKENQGWRLQFIKNYTSVWNGHRDEKVENATFVVKDCVNLTYCFTKYYVAVFASKRFCGFTQRFCKLLCNKKMKHP